MAFGSLTIGICSYLRLLLLPIDIVNFKYPFDWIGQLSLTQYLVAPVKWLIWLNDSCLRLLNNFAYIMCSTYGKSLFASAHLAIDLVARSALYAVAVIKISDLVFVVAKLVVTVNVGASAYWYFTSNESYYKFSNVNNPLSIVLIGTYWVAGVYFNLYKIAVDTILVCFCTYRSYLECVNVC